jgi:hypothetical protein
MTSNFRRSLPLILSACAFAPSGLAASPAPVLVAADTIGSETPGIDWPGAPLVVPVTALRLRFDRAPLAQLSDFRVLHAGANGAVDSDDCATIAGDDVAVPLALLIAAPMSGEITLRLDAPTGLARGHFRALVCDSLLGPGTTEWRDLVVAATPQLRNPGFGEDLSGWTFSFFPPEHADVSWTATDADDADHSGALRVRTIAGIPIRVESTDCIALYQVSPSSEHRMRFRYRVLAGAANVIAVSRFGFAGDQGEPECLGPFTEARVSIAATATGTGFATFDSGPMEHLPFPLATMHLEIQPLLSGGPLLEILLDDIGLSLEPPSIFRGSFEDTAP